MTDDDTLSLEEALAQDRETIPDDENVVRLDKATPSRSTKDDTLERNLDFINKLLKRTRVDSFNATAAAVNEAKAHLQTDNVKINIAVANVGFDGAKQYGFETQLKYGDLRVKRDEIYEIAKRLLSSGYAAWKADIKALEKTARLEQYSSGESHTAFTTPRGKYLVLNKDGAPVSCSANAITALRDHLTSHNIPILYDHWRNAISVNKDQAHFPRESKEFVVKNFVNEIYESTKVLYTIEQIKFAMGQLAVLHQQHSLHDYWDKRTWDRVDRIGKLVVDIMKLEGTEFQIAVITKQLIASVRRVKFPGAKYDLCPLLIANEGFNKSSFLTVLYGRRNVLAEDILDLTTKEQSEKLRNGIMCVEFADTLGDDKRTNARKIKAFITRQDDVGRDAYGRVEDVEHIGRTCVYWHTGNNQHLLTSEEGNRRFAPMQVLGMMDLDLLRQERDQIWAQAVELEKIGRLAYEAEMRSKGIPVNPGDEIYPDIMLEERYWNEGRQLTNQAMVKTGYEEWLSGVIYWPEVMWVTPPAKSDMKRYSISIFSSVIKDRLQVPDYKWNGEAQKISRFMRGKVGVI